MFTEVHQIVQALRNRDVEPALQWVELCFCENISSFLSFRWSICHREELLHHGSVLEFKLRQRHYLSLLSIGKINEAVSYAKVFGQFSLCHSKGESIKG